MECFRPAKLHDTKNITSKPRTNIRMFGIMPVFDVEYGSCLQPSRCLAPFLSHEPSLAECHPTTIKETIFSFKKESERKNRQFEAWLGVVEG